MTKYLLVAYALCCLFTSSLAGQLRLVEGRKSLNHNFLLNTPDGGALLVGTEHCHNPDGATIDSCLYYSRHLTRLDANADILWTNTLYSNGYYSVLRAFHNVDGGFTLFGNFNNFADCDDQVRPYSRQIDVIRTDAMGELINRSFTDNECDLELKDVTRIAEDRYAVIAVYKVGGQQEEVRAMVMNSTGQVLRERISPFRELSELKVYVNDDLNLELYYQDSTQVREVMDTLFQTLSLFSGPNLWDIGVFQDSSFFFEENVLSDDGTFHQLVTRRFYGPFRFETEYLRYDSGMNLITQRELPIQSRLYGASLHPSGEIWCVTSDKEHDEGDIAYYQLDTLGNVVGGEIIRLPGRQAPRSLSLGLDSLTLLIVGNNNCCSVISDSDRSKVFHYGPGITSTDQPSVVLNSPAFQVFPNPAGEEIRVQALAGPTNHGLRIRLFDVAGKQVQDSAIDQVIPMNGLTSGVYWYQLVGKTGTIQTGKIIKK